MMIATMSDLPQAWKPDPPRSKPIKTEASGREPSGFTFSCEPPAPSSFLDPPNLGQSWEGDFFR